MVTVWFGVGQFLSGAMGQLYPGGDTTAGDMSGRGSSDLILRLAKPALFYQMEV